MMDTGNQNTHVVFVVTDPDDNGKMEAKFFPRSGAWVDDIAEAFRMPLEDAKQVALELRENYNLETYYTQVRRYEQ